MLHIVRLSPFESRVLDECLSLMAPSDSLLLVQDAVIAACVSHSVSRLQTAGVPIYVLAEDCSRFMPYSGRDCRYGGIRAPGCRAGLAAAQVIMSADHFLDH